jgi:hypothetical protein
MEQITSIRSSLSRRAVMDSEHSGFRNIRLEPNTKAIIVPA